MIRLLLAFPINDQKKKSFPLNTLNSISLYGIKPHFRSAIITYVYSKI